MKTKENLKCIEKLEMFRVAYEVLSKYWAEKYGTDIPERKLLILHRMYKSWKVAEQDVSVFVKNFNTYKASDHE